MEGGGSITVAEALLKDNAKLTKELRESQGTVSKLKKMLKESRLRIKELEAENYERKVEDEIEKALQLFQLTSPTKEAVKLENVEPNHPPMDPLPVQVGDLVSELDSFLKRMNQTKEAGKLQEEVLSAEDLQCKETMVSTLTCDKDKTSNEKIKKEMLVETASTEDSKLKGAVTDFCKHLPPAITNVKTIAKCNNFRKEFLTKGEMKRHKMTHRKSDTSNKLVNSIDQTSPHNMILKIKTSLPRHDITKATSKDLDGKYKCNECEHKHISHKIMKFHIMNKHKGVSWDCKICSHKASSPYKLKTHIQIKHNAYRTEATRSKETSKKTIKVKKIQQILNGVGQKTLPQTKRKINKSSDGKFHCPCCDSQSTNKSYIKSHIKTKHEEHSPFTANTSHITPTDMFDITKEVVDKKVGNKNTYFLKTAH